MLPAEITLLGLRLAAISSGGVETCFQVPDFDVNLDIGRCPPGAEKRGTLLLTHGHIDHAAGLPYYVSMRGLVGFAPPKVYCPTAALGPLGRIMAGWSDLQSDAERCELIGVGPGDRVPLGGDRWAHCFATPHRIATIGYTLMRKTKKLRPDLAGEPGPAIAARVQQGEIVTIDTVQAVLCFPGDTRIEVIDKEATVGQAKILLLECTFLGPGETRQKASSGGHVHLDQIAERAADLHNEAVVLTHFSRRYSKDQIRAEVSAKLPRSLLERTWLLLHDSHDGKGILVPAAGEG